MAEDAYVTTFSAGFCSSSCFFLPPHRIEAGGQIANVEDYHIYVVARAPRVRMVPDTFVTHDGTSSCQFRIGHEFKAETRVLSFPESWAVKKVVTPDGAGRSFRLSSLDGEFEGDFPLLVMRSGQYPELLDHKVIYIGQAYGRDGSRNVIDRLTRHETLQRIVSENLVTAPDTDIFVYGFQYTDNDQVFMTFNGTDKGLIADERDDKRRDRMLANPITDKQMTQIVEAALIRYFQPEYNEKFRSLFPGMHHKFLDDLRNIDYDGFIVEINTEELGTALYSLSQGRGAHHIIKFKLTKRVTHPVFSFFRLMKEVGLDPSSGPVF